MKSKTVSKPWGRYVILEKSPNYWIKKLVVRKNESLSLQSHRGRTEFWLILSGKVEVIKGKSRRFLKAGEFVKIGKKEKHRITGIKNSEILETAFGQVAERDIARFEDKYGRIK